MRGHWRGSALEDRAFATEEERESLCEVEFAARRPERVLDWEGIAEGFSRVPLGWVWAFVGVMVVVIWAVW